MYGKPREAIEERLMRLFAYVNRFARKEHITVKRMRNLMISAAIHDMKRQGLTHQQIMAETGFSLKTIRRVLAGELDEAESDRMARFMRDWAGDPGFPDALSLNEEDYPNFAGLCDRHGHEFKPGPLLRILRRRELVTIEDDMIRVSASQANRRDSVN